MSYHIILTKQQEPTVMNWDKARDVITVLLLPALVWVFSISRTIEGERIKSEATHAQLIELRTKVERLQERDQATSLQLVRLETRLDGLRGQLDRIETMLERIINASAQPSQGNNTP